MRLRLAILIAVTAFVAVFGSARLSAQNRTQELLARAAGYVAVFMDRFSNIVAEERYVQDSKSFPKSSKKGSPSLLTRGMVQHVELTSDFLLVKSPERNLLYTFRDVYMVNGEPVRDREDRLLKLFVQPEKPAGDQLEKIALESARYTFGGDKRHDQQPPARSRVSSGSVPAAFSFLASRDGP